MMLLLYGVSRSASRISVGFGWSLNKDIKDNNCHGVSSTRSGKEVALIFPRGKCMRRGREIPCLRRCNGSSPKHHFSHLWKDSPSLSGEHGHGGDALNPKLMAGDHSAGKGIFC